GSFAGSRLSRPGDPARSPWGPLHEVGRKPHLPARMRLRSLNAGALHLLIHAAGFAVAAYALAQIVHGGSVVNFIAWFAGAAVLHDLVLLPLYSLLDRLPRIRRRPG